MERDQWARIDVSKIRAGAAQDLARPWLQLSDAANQWVDRHQERDRDRWSCRTGVSCVGTSTGWAGRPLTAHPSMSLIFSARSLTGLAATERWQAAAGAIEAYRSRWNVTGTSTIGPEPVDPEQRDHWRTTVAAVGAAGFLGDQVSPGNGSERGSLASHWEAMQEADRARGEQNIDRTDSLDDDWSPSRDSDRSLGSGFGM